MAAEAVTGWAIASHGLAGNIGRVEGLDGGISWAAGNGRDGLARLWAQDMGTDCGAGLLWASAGGIGVGAANTDSCHSARGFGGAWGSLWGATSCSKEAQDSGVKGLMMGESGSMDMAAGSGWDGLVRLWDSRWA